MILTAVLLVLFLVGAGFVLREYLTPEKMKVRRKLVREYKRLDRLVAKNDFQYLEWKKGQREIATVKENCVKLARQYVGKSRRNKERQ